LFGDAAADLVRMHICGELLGDLGLGEPHRFGSLQRRGRGPQLLQPGNSINPGRVPNRCVVGDDCDQLVQNPIQARGHWIRQ
jgi:hypothetical protein